MATGDCLHEWHLCPCNTLAIVHFYPKVMDLLIDQFRCSKSMFGGVLGVEVLNFITPFLQKDRCCMLARGPRPYWVLPSVL